MAAIRRLLRRVRLVTLCGPGGCGKTRLAIETAARQVGLQPDGAWLVDLAPLNAPDLVPEAAASVLHIRATPDQPTVDALVTCLADRRLLLLLDSCDHLVDACATLAAALLAACPGVRLLATSRQPLDVAGEVLWRVPSLAEEAAVRLFEERARSHHAGFDASGQRAAAAEICRRLDGMPLAIELAAARVTMMTPAEMLPRLQDRFTLLGRGSRGALPRQQSLKGAVDYSYELLDDDERQLFRRLSVFAGSFSLVAAEAMFGPRTLEVLGRLIDKSMVTLQLSPAGTRYRLLETLREYGRQRLAEAGESERAHNAHLDHFVAQAEATYDAWVHSGSDSGLGELELDYDDLRAALEWSRTADPAAGLRLAGAMREVWYRHGLNEGRAWLAELLARCQTGSPSRARALLAAGYVAMSSQSHDEARELLARSRELSVDLGDTHGEAMAVHALGVSATLLGSAAARGDLERGLELFERLGDRYGISASLIRLGHVAILEGRGLDEARAMLERGLQLATAVGDRWGPGAATLFLGVLAGRDGQPEVAEARLRRSLEILLPLGDVVMLSAALIEYGAGVIQRRPLLPAAGAAALLLVLSFPALSMRLSFPDSSTQPHDTSGYTSHHILAAGFGAGYDAPLVLVAQLPRSGADLTPVVDAVRTTPGVASVTPPLVSRDRAAALFVAYPNTAYQDPATPALVHRLREDVMPAVARDSGLEVSVGGPNASTIDFADGVRSRLPWLILVVVALSFLVLLALVRSVAIAVKAAVMNVLSVAAAYGVLTAIVQWGWLGQLLGFPTSMPVTGWVPLFMFPILFGLSTDYEVFLVSVIREEHDRGAPTREAVTRGLARTARLITAAAAIMITVFASNLLAPENSNKEFGLGLAVAVLIDATVVRMVLVPALMELLGEVNWWLPRPLVRLLPEPVVTE